MHCVSLSISMEHNTFKIAVSVIGKKKQNAPQKKKKLDCIVESFLIELKDGTVFFKLLTF